jgi:hypothetical protein
LVKTASRYTVQGADIRYSPVAVCGITTPPDVYLQATIPAVFDGNFDDSSCGRILINPASHQWVRRRRLDSEQGR